MRKFLACSLYIKTNLALGFSATVFLYSLAASFYGITSITFAFIWQLLGACIFISLLQFVFFSDIVIKNMKYINRLMLFNVPLVATLLGFAMVFKWFPLEKFNAWLIFAAIFIVIEVALSALFTIYSKLMGKKYMQLLEEYKRK